MRKEVIYIMGFILLIISFIYDKQIIEFIANNRVEILIPIFILIGKITAWPFLGIAAILVLNFKKKKLIPRFVFTYIITLIIVFLIRILTQIERPYTALTEVHPLSFEYSFPSGHATTAFFLLPLFIKLYPKQKYLWIILAILIPFSRLYTGLHYLSDVIFGALLGYSLSHLMFKNVRKNI